MTVQLESCTLEEICDEFRVSVEIFVELRDRLREWLLLQPHLPKDITERRLESFIVNTKLSLEQAKQKLDMYYTVRRLVPELFANRDPMSQDLIHKLQTFQWVCLPKLTPEKYRVSVLRVCDKDPANFYPWEFFKYTLMVGDVRLSECRCLGEVIIYDLAGMRLGHLAKLTPTIIKKSEVVATKAYGARIKGIHFINVPHFIDRLINLVKSIVKDKIAARTHVHPHNLDSLYALVPKSVLPSDYGGDQPTVNELSESWYEKLVEWREWFITQENVLVDESLRPGDTINDDQLFGISGTFRKLDID